MICEDTELEIKHLLQCGDVRCDVVVPIRHRKVGIKLQVL